MTLKSVGCIFLDFGTGVGIVGGIIGKGLSSSNNVGQSKFAENNKILPPNSLTKQSSEFNPGGNYFCSDAK